MQFQLAQGGPRQRRVKQIPGMPVTTAARLALLHWAVAVVVVVMTQQTQAMVGLAAVRVVVTQADKAIRSEVRCSQHLPMAVSATPVVQVQPTQTATLVVVVEVQVKQVKTRRTEVAQVRAETGRIYLAHLPHNTGKTGSLLLGVAARVVQLPQTAESEAAAMRPEAQAHLLPVAVERVVGVVTVAPASSSSDTVKTNTVMRLLEEQQ
jgi:hypothetical protein